MKENTIVSLADEKYFNLLEELIESIKSFNESKNVAICVLDAGLNQDQINKIKNKVLLNSNHLPMHRNLSINTFYN